jgi:hypothetical protein
MDIFKTMDKSLVWITLINHGYVDYTKNFLLSMQKANIDMKLVVYCINKESIDELSSFPNCVCLDAKPFLKYELPTELKEWENIDYKRICFAKLDAIYYTLTKTRNMGVKFVGFIDTDIILLKDPTQVFMEKIKKHKSINIFCQCDEKIGINGNCSNNVGCPCFCAGLIIFRNIKENYPFFLYSEKDIPTFMSDQDFLLYKFREHTATYMTIEKNVFLNGAYPGVQSDGTLILPDTAALIHFNWMVGHEKKMYMKKHGMWYI